MKIKIFSPQAIYELGKRSGQEDAIFPKMGEASELDSLFVVCDGMGGHEKGEVASQTVTQALVDFIFQNTSPEEPFTDQLFMQALETAYLQLDKIDDGSPKKPGTTLTFLYFHRNGCTVAHIGDSRIYHIRPSEGKVLYQSRDHSVVYDLYLAGEIEFDDMNKMPNKNIITKAMMPGIDRRQKANIVHIADIRPDDYFYLCSDGMLELMTNEQIVEILASDATDEQKRLTLIQETAENKDNHSAYLIHVDEVTHERRDKKLPDNEAAMMAKAIRRNDDAVDVEVQPIDSDTVAKPQPARKTSVSQSYGKNEKKQTKERTTRRSMLVPIITTAALLLILAGVYFTCSGKDEKSKKEVKVDPKDEEVVEKPIKKDTMNIVGGETPTNALPAPTDGLQQPGQQKTEEKKPEEKKPEDNVVPPTENINGEPAKDGNTPPPPPPSDDHMTPNTGNGNGTPPPPPPTNANGTGTPPPPPPSANTGTPPPATTGQPKSVIPDDEQ